MSIEIINGGPLSTVQDLGRFGVMKKGFGQSGAMDSFSLKTANRLVGNCLNCAAIEMTMAGISAKFTENHLIALSGGDFKSTLNGVEIRPDKAYQVRAGDLLQCGCAVSGARCYLAVSGGIDVPVIMGSRSTNLKSAFGGYRGRKLKAGDVLSAGCYNIPIPAADISRRETESREYPAEITVRAIPGPQDYLFSNTDKELFFSREYVITAESDRMGIRLNGEPLKGKGSMDIISDGIVLGSVQIPASGRPIVLMADHQTTGGYAKLATVISVDISRLAQARPGNMVKFRRISVKEAERAAKKEKKYFDNLLL